MTIPISGDLQNGEKSVWTRPAGSTTLCVFHKPNKLVCRLLHIGRIRMDVTKLYCELGLHREGDETEALVCSIWSKGIKLCWMSLPNIALAPNM
jgi:hypothetical protein